MREPEVLVAGASGQLGSAVVRKLRARSMAVRALVRADSRIEHLQSLGVDIRVGDLRDPASLVRAVEGVDYVVATANAAVPRKASDTLRAVDVEGYRALIDASRQALVAGFIYVSVCTSVGEESVPLFRAKRELEAYLQASGLPYTILRAAAFMDLVFAMMGSDLPLRGADAPTAERPFWFSHRFFSSVRDNLERGRLGVIGSGATRHSFIAVNDVAEFAVRSLGKPWARNATFEIGGPQALSLRDVASLYQRICGHPIRVQSTPVWVFRLLRSALAPFSEAAANLASLNVHSATQDGVVPHAGDVAARFEIQLTTAERFLRSKSSQREAAGSRRSPPVE
jgi:uncharacterized protein YbjT (DUF2867 family)